jgi:phage terminase large subunit
MATAAPVELNVQFPAGYDFLFEPHRYKVAHGGRGSTKSWSFARALILCAYREKQRILCARELQTSISESVHKLLADQIELMGLGAFFEVQQQGIYGTNGSEFFFYGIRNNITKVKSAEGINKVWCEEAEKISNNSWQVLIPTIREMGSEIWVTFNPDEENDPTYQRFVVNQKAIEALGGVVRVFNWQQNPWFHETELVAEKDYLYRTDAEAANHVWGGQCRQNASSQIFRGKYVVEAFTVPAERWEQSAQGWDGPYYGADWGFSQDPTVLVKLWTKGYQQGRTMGKLYIEKESWGLGVENDSIGPKWMREIPEVRDNPGVVRADSARPETINHVASHSGLRVEAAEKWKGSVEDGVAFLKSFEQIVVHPRCEHEQFEMQHYSYKVDKLTGDVLADIVDKHNHNMDAKRYAFQPLIMAGTSAGVWARL